METFNSTYSFENFDITIRGDNSHFYFTVINNIDLIKYESKFTPSDLDEKIGIRGFLLLVKNTFGNKPNYYFNYKINKNFIELQFKFNADSICDIEQVIRLNEINYSNNQLSTIKINQLEKRIKDLETPTILLGCKNFGDFLKLKTDIEELDYTKISAYKFFHSPHVLNQFQNINKLIINYNTNWNICNTFSFYDVENGVFIQYDDNFYRPDKVFSKVINVFDNQMVYLPSVKFLEISNWIDLDGTIFRSLPNIEIFKYVRIGNDESIVKLVNFIKNHKFKKIIFENLPHTLIENVDQLKIYCMSNNINYCMGSMMNN